MLIHSSKRIQIWMHQADASNAGRISAEAGRLDMSKAAHNAQAARSGENSNQGCGKPTGCLGAALKSEDIARLGDVLRPERIEMPGVFPPSIAPARNYQYQSTRQPGDRLKAQPISFSDLVAKDPVC